MQALRKNLGLTTERIATPLDHDPQIPRYLSSQQEDKVFGANLDGFSTVWEGASHCQPELEHYEMKKAVRWAICSASDTDSPCLTSFALPSYTNSQSAYHKYLSHPLVHLVTKIPKANFRYENSRQVPKRDMIIFYVANKQGHEIFVRPTLAQELLEATHALITTPLVKLPQCSKATPCHLEELYAPRSYQIIHQGPQNEILLHGAACRADGNPPSSRAAL